MFVISLKNIKMPSSLLRIQFSFCSFFLCFYSYHAISEEVSPDSMPLTTSGAEVNLPLIMFIVSFLVLAILLTILISRRKKVSLKYILHHQYAYFDRQDKHICLYKRHEKSQFLQLNVNDICEYIILLNDVNLITINTEKQGIFNQERELQLRKSITQEQQHKMVDERIRKITVILTDKQNKKYIICFYLRLGNQRLTKIKFNAAIEEVIEWCWFFNKTINPDATGKIQVDVNTELSAQSNKIHITNSSSPLSLTKASSLKGSSTTTPLLLPKITVEENSICKSNNNQQENGFDYAEVNTSISQSHADTELINALEKLAMLQKEGYLNAEEFSEAKHKILLDLSNK